MLPLAELGSAEIGALISIVGSIVGGVIVIVKWLPKHFDQLVRAHEKDRGASRADFLVALNKQADTFTAALAREVQECARQRELDRDQRELDRQERAEQHGTFLRLVGLVNAGDTGVLRPKQNPIKRSGSSEDGRREPS